jgi:hypothetical protein
VAALAASGIEVETNLPTLGQLAESTQQLIACRETGIAVEATCVKAERRDSVE